MRILNSFFFLLLCLGVQAQTAVLKGKIYCAEKKCDEAFVLVEGLSLSADINNKGEYRIDGVPFGEITLIAFAFGYETLYQKVLIDSSVKVVDIQLKALERELNPVIIQEERLKKLSVTRLKGIEGTTVYEGKKTEVVSLTTLQANLTVNNPRQVFGRITGVHIWESDAAGLQLGVGGRGLSPNRSANFNTRQNGYDISADALGYPESYYTPPLEAMERIEVLKGAASLQYGTQFGGMINFVGKKGSAKPIVYEGKQSLGSYGYLGSFNSLNGTVAKGKLNYYTYYQYKEGNSWRENSKFKAQTYGVRLSWKINKAWSQEFEYTGMNYLAQQAGGLTDFAFDENPQQSIRDRNWFKVDWNLFSWQVNFKPDSLNQFNLRTFGLLANRNSLGNLDRINRADPGGNRTLIAGDFKNIGQEFRWRRDYSVGKQKNSFVLGYRLYRGTSIAKQGDGNAGAGADFVYLNPDNLENSDYQFLNYNAALFIEHIWRLSDKFSLTPGLRAEYIDTRAQGYYRQIIKDGAGNIVVDNRFQDDKERSRAFIIGGIGAQYTLNKRNELYANFSQNYRAINFTDLRVNNPNLRIDSNLRDEKGFTADLGIRGERSSYFIYELTAFYLSYDGRIGQVLRTGEAPLFLDYRFRTNVSDARNLGLEAMAEINLFKLFAGKKLRYQDLSVFVNGSYINARYINSKDPSIDGNEVEMVPTWMLRSGLRYRYKKFKASLQGNFTSEHFSDATNSSQTASAVEGIIPAYYVMDFSAGYQAKYWSLDLNISNLLNTAYFTRRADSYPGPGIIPAEARALYLTLGIQLGR